MIVSKDLISLQMCKNTHAFNNAYNISYLLRTSLQLAY